jgi:hypothetical protein
MKPQGWERLRGFAIAKLGMTSQEYYDTTLADLMLAHHTYQQRETESWRRTRSVMFTMVRLWGDPKKMPSSISAFFPLPGDKTDKSPLDLSAQEQKQLFEDLRKQGWQV